jgi:hypothetical protein
LSNRPKQKAANKPAVQPDFAQAPESPVQAHTASKKVNKTLPQKRDRETQPAEPKTKQSNTAGRSQIILPKGSLSTAKFSTKRSTPNSGDDSSVQKFKTNINNKQIKHKKQKTTRTNVSSKNRYIKDDDELNGPSSSN